MKDDQPAIPGLDSCLTVEKPLKNNDRASLQQQLTDLQGRILRLELEVSLLKILVEKSTEEVT